MALLTLITAVEPGSYAARAGIVPGDVLVSLDGHEIQDVLDYRFYMTEPRLTLELTRDGAPYSVTVRKGEYDDLGLEFDTPLMDNKHRCANKCIFCFIDQLPPGMRETLYFKDDDSRLSFLHGNYVTLTNLTDDDIDRIIKMHISPLRVSVHTTDPGLRVSMMKNPRAGEVLSYLRRVADAGLDISAQIVLCRGINDGAALERTMRDLVSYLPALQSVSIVPAGLTKYRDKLYPLSLFTPCECRELIEQVNRMGERCLREHGRRIFFCADEIYVRGGLPLPDADFYEGFDQLEDGVGLIAALLEDFVYALEDTPLPESSTRRVTIATGTAAYSTISYIARRLCEAVPGLWVQVVAIKNEFFGETVTVAGLLTATDIAAQLKDADLGDALLIPAVALRRSGEPVFLDDKTPEWLSRSLGGITIIPTENSGESFVNNILGL